METPCKGMETHYQLHVLITYLQILLLSTTEDCKNMFTSLIIEQRLHVHVYKSCGYQQYMINSYCSQSMCLQVLLLSTIEDYLFTSLVVNNNT